MQSDNAVVVWFPLVPLTPDMGLLQAIPGSHAGGLVPFCEWERHEPFTTAGALADEDFRELAIEEDELLIFNQFLLHRSGHNRSRSVRLSVQVRYNDLATLKEMTSSFTAGHSRYVLQRQKEVLASRDAHD